MKRMKVDATIYKGSDGFYTCYVEDELPGFILSGYGETAEEAKADMLSVYEDIKELRAEEGKETIELDIVYKYDLQAFFNYFNWLNTTKVAEAAGVNPSLMRQYSSGVAKAGEKQYEKIRTAINKMSTDLYRARL
nr:MAG TPA: antitoxin [Caudoviricetes sp.]